MAENNKTAPVCVISGAGTGIGQANAIRFAELGYRIVGCGRNKDSLHSTETAISGESHMISLDLSEPRSASTLIEYVMDKCGRIDVLINNAALGARTSIEAMTIEQFEQLYAVNIRAVFQLTQAAWPIMKQQGGGVIVNISSMASIDPFPGLGIYGASKAWVNLLTKAAANEGRPLGIRVFSVALGAVETRMLRSAFPDFPSEKTLSPEEVARFISTLCDDSMQYTSGQTIIVRK